MAAGDPRVTGGEWPPGAPGHPADSDGSLDMFSPHNYIEDLRRSGAAIYSYSGWMDGAYPHSAIKRFLTLGNPGNRLVIGPWNHGGGWAYDPPSGRSRKSRFDHNIELLRFFDRHLKGIETGLEREKPVHYFTMIENRWKESDSWPPSGARTTLYLGPDRRLTETAPPALSGTDSYKVDPASGTGPMSRFRNQTLLDQPVEYPDRLIQDRKLLLYESVPLDKDMEVTGHPLLTLFVQSTAEEGHFFAYLEDVDEKGRVAYVTEGQLGAIHRKLSDEKPPYEMLVPYRTFKRKDAMPMVPGEVAEIVFDLIPTSYLFKKGHSIRLALAGADTSHFAMPAGDPPTWTVHRSTSRPSHLVLPVVHP